jgi:DeoR/GlpR family transcriptional regulator of sugar metabolism
MSISPLYPEIRRKAILDQVEKDGQVTVQALSRQYSVSEVTIRTDLQILSEIGLVLRTHGGAVAIADSPELSVVMRQQKQVAEKNRIGEYCAGLVHDGDAIFLDISTTALALSRHLRSHRNLTVITNSLITAQELLEIPTINVIIPGGTVQKETLSVTGMDGLGWIKKYNLQMGFFGAHGIGFPEGLTDVSEFEAQVKTEMVQQCKVVVGIFDATKWGRVGFASFAALDEIDLVVTDQKADDALVAKAFSSGIEVIKV